MKTPFISKSLSDSTRRRVELAVAVAQERLLSTHVDHALALIELVGQRLPFDHLLDIYTRLLRLSEDEARVITTRALATLGERRADDAPAEAPPAEVEPVDSETSGRSFMQNIRQRLRGRVNEELRRWIELAAARTEVALLETHVENALNFIEILEKEQAFPDAVELYLDSLEVRDSVAEMVYYLTLARLSEEHLPGPSPRRRETPDSMAAAAAAEERRLRVVESEQR